MVDASGGYAGKASPKPDSHGIKRKGLSPETPFTYFVSISSFMSINCFLPS